MRFLIFFFALLFGCTDAFAVATPIPKLLRVHHTPTPTPHPTATPKPSVQTVPANNIDDHSAKLQANVNPNGSATQMKFSYGTTVSYGTDTSNQGCGSGNSKVSKTAVVTGLTSNTTYHYRAVANNGGGTTSGSDITFTTKSTSTPTPPPTPTPTGTPNVVTGAASNVAQTTVTMNGLVNPLGLSTMFKFDYGTTTSYGTSTTPASAGNANHLDPQSADVTGLSSSTLYHFRIEATNANGTNLGDDKTVTTLTPTPTPTPTPTATPTPTPIASVRENYRTTSTGVKLFWTAYPQPTPATAVLVLHVGGYKAGVDGPQGVASSLQLAGFFALTPEYRLAPPHGPMNSGPPFNHQTPAQNTVVPVDDGHYPEQTEDVLTAIHIARNDPRCNGRVVVVGGSAGASHSLYAIANGTPGDTQPDLAVLNSIGVSNLADPVLLGYVCDPNQTCPHQAITNYQGLYPDPYPTYSAPELAILAGMSPITNMHVGMPPIFVAVSNKDSLGIPTSTGYAMHSYNDDGTIGQDETNVTGGLLPHLESLGIHSDTSAFPVTNTYHFELVQVDGHSHAFDYWTKPLNGVSGQTTGDVETAWLKGSAPSATPFPMLRGVVSLTSGIGSPILDEAINSLDVVAIDYGDSWWHFEGTDGGFDPDTGTDVQIARIAAAGKKCILRGLCGMGGSHSNGGGVPDWVYKAVGDANGVALTGAAGEKTIYPGITYLSDAGVLIPVFWEPTFLAKKIAMIKAAGAHWANNDTIRVVAISNANINTEDWNVPHGGTLGVYPPPNDHSEVQRWLDSPTDPSHPGAGYTSAKLIDALKQIISAAMDAFPRQIITMAIGENGPLMDVAAAGSNSAAKAYVAKTVSDWAYATYPGRFSTQANQFRTSIATAGTDTDGSMKLLYDYAQAGKYTGGQNVWYVAGDHPAYKMNQGSSNNLRYPTSVQYPNVTLTDDEILEQACDKAAGTSEIHPGYGLRTLEIYERDVKNLPTGLHYCAGLLNP